MSSHPGTVSASAWDEARSAYLNAKAAEDAYDNGPYATAIGHAERQGPHATFDDRLTDLSDRITDIRGAAEDALMDIPAPDAAGFALKYLVARGSGRETDCWNEMLEREARRFAAIADENIRFDAAFAEFKRLHAIELAMSPRTRDEEKVFEGATDATTAAFDRMIAISVTDGVRAASKLSALAALFDLPMSIKNRDQFERFLDELLGILKAGVKA